MYQFQCQRFVQNAPRKQCIEWLHDMLFLCNNFIYATSYRIQPIEEWYNVNSNQMNILSICNTKLIKMVQNVNWLRKVTLWMELYWCNVALCCNQTIHVYWRTSEYNRNSHNLFIWQKYFKRKKYFCATGCVICNLIYSLTFCTKWYHLSCFPFFHPRLQIIEYTQENTCCSLTLMLCVAGEWTEED